MKLNVHTMLYRVICLALLPSMAVAAAGITPRLQSALTHAKPNDELVLWIYFKDKGARELMKSSVPRSVVSDRSLARRRNVLAADRLVDYTDLPIDERYVEGLRDKVLQVRQRSKWFNAVSVVATPDQIPSIALSPYVREIGLVARFAKERSREKGVTFDPETDSSIRKGSAAQTLNYGSSFSQVNLINIPPLHDANFAGDGVIIGVFDNGFRLPDHEAFQSMSILATYDFVDNKESVVPDNPSPTFGSHGISVLSVIGGYVSGTLIGPAFRATYLLARTENDSSETPVEEDNWVAAIEWADSLGVQVTNTSLGYLYYDPPYESWTWEDMDGRTTLISRAATMAARKGIVVCNSAGNNGYHPERNTLNAAADADSILGVGAANPDGSRASFSSVGPTTDVPPRIKPDIMAQGSQIVAASGSNPTGYILTQGTSLSSPLAAGTAALLIQAMPDASPMEIIEALKSTASQASSADNLNGWGIIDAVDAITDLTGTDTIISPPLPNDYVLSQNYPNPFNPGTRLRYELPEAARVTIVVYDILGREIRTLRDANHRPGTFYVDWDGRDSDGIAVASGVYVARFRAVGVSGRSTILDRKMMRVQ